MAGATYICELPQLYTVENRVIELYGQKAREILWCFTVKDLQQYAKSLGLSQMRNEAKEALITRLVETEKVTICASLGT